MPQLTHQKIYLRCGVSYPAVPEGVISTTNTFTFNSGEILAFAIRCYAVVDFWTHHPGDRSFKIRSKRRLQYLPPKIALEGHGIKRGLTAVEAAILMEEPMDKILTMVLFSTIKKQAASIVKNEPLEVKVEDTLPEDLQEYEKSFLAAFKNQDARQRRLALQEMMISLVKTVGEK